MSTAPTDPSNGSGEMVLVPKEVLKELEELRKLKEELPVMIDAGIIQNKKDRLKALDERLKDNPELKQKKNERWYTKHKEEYNARRREAYKKKKQFLSPPEDVRPSG